MSTRGLEKAHWIKPGNYWMPDNAYSTQTAGENWSAVTLSWKIPIGWHRKNPDYTDDCDVQNQDYEKAWDDKSRPLIIGGRTDKYKQVFTIDAEGTSKVEKFGHWLSRGRYCKIILDGVLKKWNHWF